MGVVVVTHLLPLVAIDAVDPSLSDGTRQVGEKPVQLGARVVGAGEAAGPEAHGRHVERAAILLDEHVSRQL